MDRRARILDGLKLDGLGLEIGGGYGPLVAGDPALRVKTLDYLDQAGLVARYEPAGIDTSRIQPVDYVWSGQRYADLVGEARFDWIVASHVIEHVPDMVGFICGCAEILNEGGVLTLVVPDKRREFDIYRPPSGLGAIIDAHLQGRRLSSPGLTAEFALNVAKLDGRDIWTDRDRGVPAFGYRFETAQALMQKAAAGEYVDIHAWVFTPHSFRLLIDDLHNLGLVPLRERRFEDSGEHEFLIQLSTDGSGSGLDRATLSRLALEEQPEAFAPPPADQVAPDPPPPSPREIELQARLEAVYASTSWRFSTPLRALRRMLGG